MRRMTKREAAKAVWLAGNAKTSGYRIMYDMPPGSLMSYVLCGHDFIDDYTTGRRIVAAIRHMLTTTEVIN